jgi:formylglycine-generating enzyme required for sulfatase activity
VKGVTFRFRWIPPGTFLRGAEPEEEGSNWEETQHEVTLTNGFWLGETPVTQAQWVAVMRANPSHFAKGGAYPVERVSWDDCDRFCTRFQILSPGPEARLPSDAEWEYACRAQTLGPRWDMTRPLTDLAWFDENANGCTHPVGEKLPNPWGLYDMLGNVWEKVAGSWEIYDIHPLRDPHVFNDGNRVFRGGAYYISRMGLRAAQREGDHPDASWKGGGFRLARGVPLVEWHLL